jgi:hypothetical protein
MGDSLRGQQDLLQQAVNVAFARKRRADLVELFQPAEQVVD